MSQPQALDRLRGFARRQAKTLKDSVGAHLTNRPVADYAAVLDGDALWLRVRGLPPDGRLGLRARGDGAVLELEALTPGDVDPGLVSGWVDLLPHAARLARDEAGHELVGLDSDRPGGAVRVAWGGSQPLSPIRPPSTSDGCWRFRLQYGGSLVLTAAPLQACARVISVRLGEDDLVFRIQSPFPVDQVRLTEKDGRQLALLPLLLEGDSYVLRVTEEDVVLRPGQVALVAAVSGSRETPVRRVHEDLKEPGPAVVLPRLSGSDPELSVAVLKPGFRPDGQLTIRRPHPTQAEGETL